MLPCRPVRSSLPCWVVVVLCLPCAAGAMAWPGVQGGRALYLPLIVREAALRGLPPALADAVAMIETGYRPDAIGSAGEVGLMQVMPATARQLGFAGTLAELADPATNIRLGVTYLAKAWAAAGGDVCRALTRYRAGLGQTVMTALSARYCTRAMAWLSAMGGRLTAPRPETDPHVVAVLPALAALPGLRRASFITDAAPGALPRRTMAERIAARNARFLSHLRQRGPPTAESQFGE